METSHRRPADACRYISQRSTSRLKARSKSMLRLPKVRYSVSTILLVTALVAVSISTVLNRWQIAEMNREKREVTRQTGYIDVDDPTKVHVRELFCPAPETWQFQIYTPMDHQLMAGIGSDLTGNEHDPTRLLGEAYFRRSGQTTITISIFKDAQGRWRVAKYYPFNGSSIVVPNGDFSWLLERKSRINAGSGGEPLHGPVRAYNSGDRIPILVLRDEAGKGTSQHGNSSGSIMVWLEPNLLSNFRLRELESPRREITER